tara:strand:- start:396 stop:1784 length:1389 start_codon:yes stop_codon:yes gene_type:complete
MKLCFSGFTRKAHLDVIKEAQVKSVVLDYGCDLHRNPELIGTFDFVIINYSLNKLWSRYKYLWDESSAKRQKQIKNKSIEELQLGFMERARKELRAYLDWISELPVDVIAYPSIPVDVGYDDLWKEYGVLDKAMPTITSIDQIKPYLAKYAYVGYSKDLELEELQGEVFSNIKKYKESGVKIHGWGRSSKKDITSGIFFSVDSSTWAGGGRYGNTYHYVGNMKMVTHSSKRGRGKEVREQFATECLKYGVDRDGFLNDDQHQIDLWNCHQWKRYSMDSEYVGGYWTKRELPSENKSIIKAESKALDQVFQTTALANGNGFGASLRSCNSCFLSPNCPVYEPDSQCNLSSDPKVNTPQDLQSLVNKVIQIQGERVLFASYAEKIQNNGINPEVSTEVQTLMQVMKDAKEILAPSSDDEITIKAKGSGVISRLFGGYGRSGGGGSRPSQSEKIIDVSPMEKDDE